MIKKSEQDEREYIDRIPFVSEILKRIDDISQSIRHGNTGEDEAINLLTDLPDSWKSEIQDKLDRIEANYNANKNYIGKRYHKGTPSSFKRELDAQLLDAGKDYSRSIKRTIINLLDSKGLLFLTKNAVPESTFFDLHDRKSEDNEP